VTTNYIILELVALITARRGIARSQLVQLVNQIKRLPQIHLIHIDPTTDGEAWAMLERYTDKRWSLVDASSFVIMRRFGLTEAFTTDEHFTQAGFIRVPTVP
jgi:predicted nucleic acid-binding protein